MKQNMTLVAAMLGACIVAPLAGNASLPTEKTNDSRLNATPVVKTSVRDRDRVVYAVTKTTETGSLIPTVYRIYRGRVTTATSKPGTTLTDLKPAGSEDVAGALVRLDPSISFSVAHR